MYIGVKQIQGLERYLDFGSKVIEQNGHTWLYDGYSAIVQTKDNNTEWQYRRLKSGLMTISEPFETIEALKQWTEWKEE